MNRTIVWRSWRQRLDNAIGGDEVGIGIGRPTDLARLTLEMLPRRWSFYDAMDDFPEFYSGAAQRWTGECEAEIAAGVDVIVTPSSALWTKFAPQAQKRVMLANAFDMAALPPVAERTSSAVLGYVGTIARWFDWPIIVRLAARPELTIRIIGPRFSEPPSSLPSNVTVLPECSEAEAIEHLRHFTVGLIPFTRTRLTDGVDPVKYYAYRGMGLPVLTTRFGEMSYRAAAEATYFLDDPDGLKHAVTAALGHRTPPDEVARFRAEHSWQRRFDSSELLHRLSAINRHGGNEVS